LPICWGNSMRETATLRRGMLSLGPRHRIAALSSKMTTHERTCTGEGAAAWLEVRVPQPNAMDVQTGREMNRAVRAAPLAIGISAVVVPGGTAQTALTDQQIAAIIVKESRDALLPDRPSLRLPRRFGAQWVTPWAAKRLHSLRRRRAVLLRDGRPEREDWGVSRRCALRPDRVGKVVDEGDRAHALRPHVAERLAERHRNRGRRRAVTLSALSGPLAQTAIVTAR
jgi:hypothetical protein